MLYNLLLLFIVFKGKHTKYQDRKYQPVSIRCEIQSMVTSYVKIRKSIAKIYYGQALFDLQTSVHRNVFADVVFLVV